MTCTACRTLEHVSCSRLRGRRSGICCCGAAEIEHVGPGMSVERPLARRGTGAPFSAEREPVRCLHCGRIYDDEFCDCELDAIDVEEAALEADYQRLDDWDPGLDAALAWADDERLTAREDQRWSA
jgi:hypothetical protein